jgi:ribosomal protein L37AE/L43A
MAVAACEGEGEVPVAKLHHCPNCGEQKCNALSNKVHLCPKCLARWEEEVQVA